MSVLHNIAASLPPFTDDPVDRLRHTVAAYRETDPARWAITATANAYPAHDRTGLTYGDLAALLDIIDAGGVR
jgi:hypothetical protein